MEGRLIALGMLILMVNAAALADEELMYRLGGGVPISLGPAPNYTPHSIGGSVSWEGDFTCGNFDLSTSVTNQLNGVSGAFQQLMGQVVDSATGVVASLPALAIQRLNPALYDLLQNGVLQASEEFHLAEVRCETMVEAMRDRLASDGWRGLAEGAWWREEAQSTDGDLVAADEAARREGQDAGVPWIGDVAAGGAGQPPITLHRDVAVAGANLLLDRAVSETASFSAAQCDGAALCQSWNSPGEVASWLTGVIGETALRTCAGCEAVASRHGAGLPRVIDADARRIVDVLTPMLGSSAPPNPDTLASVSASGGLAVSRRLIEALRDEPRSSDVLARLAGELALARQLERALMARRVLLAGRKEPNVANNDHALLGLDRALAELDREMDAVLLELDVRSRLAANTPVAILQRARQRTELPMVQPTPANPLINGAIAE